MITVKIQFLPEEKHLHCKEQSIAAGYRNHSCSFWDCKRHV